MLPDADVAEIRRTTDSSGPRPVPVLIAVLAALTVLVGACSSDDNASSEADKDAQVSTTVANGEKSPNDEDGLRSVVFDGGDDGIDTFRIPGAVTSTAGTILVFAEARFGSPHDLRPRTRRSATQPDGHPDAPFGPGSDEV